MAETEISIRNNGPVLIPTENIVVKDADGNAIDLAGKANIALCRCGASEKKPFCDGAHNRCGFESTIKAADLNG